MRTGFLSCAGNALGVWYRYHACNILGNTAVKEMYVLRKIPDIGAPQAGVIVMKRCAIQPYCAASG